MSERGVDQHADPSVMSHLEGLLRGDTRFTPDLTCPGMLHLVYVRSPHASARIAHIDVGAARAAPGVAAVYTATDLPVLPIWEIALIPEEFAQPPLARHVVRHVGERIVAIAAESVAAGVDGAELVVVDYEPLPVVTDVIAARQPDGPVLFAGRPDNICLEWPRDAQAPDFEASNHIVRVDNVIPRLSVAPLEGHAVVAVPGENGRLTVWVSTQVPRATQRQLARSLAMPIDDVRVVAPAVGGGFGGKAAGGLPDHVVAAAVARTLGRPVCYVEDRAANLLSMQGRGVSNHVELHAKRDGTIVGVRSRIVCDAGAYPTVGAVEPGKTRMMACGPYRVVGADIDAKAVVTNLPPVGAYRGPGRSEAAVMLERAVDILAADLNVDPLELRRRNVLRADELPHTTPTGAEYDEGDYVALLDELARVSEYDNLRRQQVVARQRGILTGIGLAIVVDSTAWFARTEGAAVAVASDGTVIVKTGTASAGQHHDSLYRRIVMSLLPVSPASIRVITGDTDVWALSDGSMGSRTAQVAGTAVLRSTELAVERLRDLAASALEAQPGDIVFHPGLGFGVAGVPSSACSLATLVANEPEPVEASCVYEQVAATYPAAAHLSLVTVDVDTGRVVPVRHVCVTDCGTVLDLTSARGQVIGASVQGIGQALYEESVFDDSGTPLTTSFADYAIPSAAEVPAIETYFLTTPTNRNPLGAKGVGELGMVAAPVAVQNAVVDAIRHLGVRHIDMPCTPQKVWAALAHS